MKRHVNVWLRTDRVEARLERASPRRDATQVAHATGVDPHTLIRETEAAEALVARARAAGAITREQITAYAAQELGIDPDELRAETERLAAMRAR